MKTLQRPTEVLANAVYTPAEAARILKVSPLTVARKIRRGELPASKLGKSYRLLGRDLLSLFEWKTRMREAFDRVGRRIKAAGFTVEDVPRIIAEVRKEQAEAEARKAQT